MGRGHYVSQENNSFSTVIEHNRLVPSGEHLSAAEELAEKVLKSPPLATRAAVKLTRRQWVQPGADADMQMLPLKLHLTEDFKEASQSFVEKRPPKYHAK